MSDVDSPGSEVPTEPASEPVPVVVSDDAKSKGPRHKKRVKRSRTTIILISLALVVVLVVGAVVGDYYYINSLVHHVIVKTITKKEYNHSENILLVGSTTRCGLAQQNVAYGLCSQGVTGVNSDVVMILHLDLTTNQVSILSVPRDLFVPNARVDGANKIDAALYNGPSQLVAAIQEDFGIPINHYIELNFDTFADVVNVLGGINMYFPMDVFDAYSGLHITQTGCVHLDGYRALQVVRARHLQIRYTGYALANFRSWPQEGLSDLARIRRDHEFLKVLAAAVKAKGISNPITDQRLATAVARYLTVDQSFTTEHMLSLAEHFAGISIGAVPELTVPVVLVETGTYLYQGYYYGDVEFPIEPGVTQTVDRFLDLAPSINTMTGKPLPKNASITVSVVDGTGVTNQAQVIAAGLRRQGFIIHGLAAATPFGTREETIVYHANNSAIALAAAQAVLHTIEGPAVMALGPTTGGALVTVLTGSDISVLAPRPLVTPTTTTTNVKHKKRKTAATTTTTNPNAPLTVVDPPAVKTDTSLSAPTDVIQALQPWDPRSCGPGGTEGP
jgi:LCP family protein required for cell wall assembly